VPRFLVNFPGQRNQRFELAVGEHLIGREQDAQLQLANVSVSRHHAKITVTPKTVTVEDLGSGNGTLVNNKAVESQVLASNDEVRIGKFTLIYLTDEKRDEFHKGRCVKYLPVYHPKQAEAQHIETFVLSKDALKAMQNQERLVEDARLVLERDASRFWHPEDRPLTFGASGAHIRPLGWYVFGQVAQVTWDGSRHVLEKQAFWVPVSVNGEAVTKRPLRKGDRIQVGQSRFKYDVS
jgi:hypothetical protein